MRALAIDFETANEGRASPCALGLAWIEDGRITHREYRLVRPPEMRFSPWNVRVHGIRPEDVADARELPDVVEAFMPDIVGQPLVAHNAGFDVAVLCATLAWYGLPVPRLSFLCTRLLGKRAWPGEPRYGLAALAAKVGVTFRHHHAGDDAAACAEVAIAAAEAAGTRHLSVAAERLGIRLGRVDWPLRSPCMTASLGGAPREAEITLRPRAGRVGSGRLAFAMRGSGGQSYEVVGTFAAQGYALRCSCMAGQNRIRCRHVTALLDGEITDLASDNLYDLEKLRVVVQAVGAEAVWPPERKPRAAAPHRDRGRETDSPPVSDAKASARVPESRFAITSV